MYMKVGNCKHDLLDFNVNTEWYRAYSLSSIWICMVRTNVNTYNTTTVVNRALMSMVNENICLIFIATFVKLQKARQSVLLESEKNKWDDHYHSKVCVCDYVTAHRHSYASFSRLNTKMLFKRSPLLQETNENKWQHSVGGSSIPRRNLHSSVICTGSFLHIKCSIVCLQMKHRISVRSYFSL